MQFNERKDRDHLFGMELIPETEREGELLRRFWAGGVNLGSFNGRDLSLDFGDLVEPVKRTTQYGKEYLTDRMADFIAFRSALRDMGHTFSDVGEILLYQTFRR